ncbi:hypothetical protein P7C70_g727, partial [Phenoliferia sp. Uapishka_3]
MPPNTRSQNPISSQPGPPTRPSRQPAKSTTATPRSSSRRAPPAIYSPPPPPLDEESLQDNDSADQVAQLLTSPGKRVAFNSPMLTQGAHPADEDSVDQEEQGSCNNDAEAEDSQVEDVEEIDGDERNLVDADADSDSGVIVSRSRKRPAVVYSSARKQKNYEEKMQQAKQQQDKKFAEEEDERRRNLNGPLFRASASESPVVAEELGESREESKGRYREDSRSNSDSPPPPKRARTSRKEASSFDAKSSPKRVVASDSDVDQSLSDDSEPETVDDPDQSADDGSTDSTDLDHEDPLGHAPEGVLFLHYKAFGDKLKPAKFWLPPRKKWPTGQERVSKKAAQIAIENHSFAAWKNHDRLNELEIDILVKKLKKKKSKSASTSRSRTSTVPTSDNEDSLEDFIEIERREMERLASEGVEDAANEEREMGEPVANSEEALPDTE